MIKNIIRQIRLFSNARKEPYLLFHQILGFYPDNIDYYQLAVRHKSVSITTSNGTQLSNERLEFLGDAVLNSVVTDILYHRYSTESEGFLTNTRSKLVKRDTLNQLAFNIGLDKVIKTTRYVNTHTNNNIYGNALEAIMGAIYLDYGYKKCKFFVENRLLGSFINLDDVAINEVNFKSKLIEWCQKNRFEAEFNVINETLVDSNKHHFESSLSIQGIQICTASGSSKKESQQKASETALELLQKNKVLLIRIKNNRRRDDKQQQANTTDADKEDTTE